MQTHATEPAEYFLPHPTFETQGPLRTETSDFNRTLNSKTVIQTRPSTASTKFQTKLKKPEIIEKRRPETKQAGPKAKSTSKGPPNKSQKPVKKLFEEEKVNRPVSSGKAVTKKVETGNIRPQTVVNIIKDTQKISTNIPTKKPVSKEPKNERSSCCI